MANQDNNRNAALQQSVESLPANVKAQAVEAARPAAQLLDRATTPSSVPPPPPTPTSPARERGLGIER
jgi:hypothetical protein